MLYSYIFGAAVTELYNLWNHWCIHLLIIIARYKNKCNQSRILVDVSTYSHWYWVGVLEKKSAIYIWEARMPHNNIKGS